VKKSILSKRRSIVSIVVPCYNEEEVLGETVEELTALLQRLIEKRMIDKSSFVLLVDDGSSDNTWELIGKSAQDASYIRGIRLSRNQGHQTALLAGMEYVKDDCDCLVTIDADLQQDVRAIEKFMERFYDGVDIVLGVREDRESDSFIKKSTALFFYKSLSLMGVKAIKNHADYRLLSKRAVNYLLDFQEANLFLRGMIPLLGFKQEIVYFQVKRRSAGQTKYTLRKMISFAIDGITSFSIAPLRMITVLGFMTFIASFMMSAYVLGITLFTNDAIPGWASTVLPIYFIGGIQILSLGIVGEYIGKIYKESKRRPKYFIENEV